MIAVTEEVSMGDTAVPFDETKHRLVVANSGDGEVRVLFPGLRRDQDDWVESLVVRV